LRERISIAEDYEMLPKEYFLGLQLMLLRRYSNAKRELEFRVDEKLKEVLQNQEFTKIRMTLFAVIQEVVNNDLKYGNGKSNWSIGFSEKSKNSLSLNIETNTNYTGYRFSSGHGEINIKNRIKSFHGILSININNNNFNLIITMKLLKDEEVGMNDNQMSWVKF